MHKTAMTLLVNFHFLGKYLGVELLGLYRCLLSFTKNCQMLYHFTLKN